MVELGEPAAAELKVGYCFVRYDDLRYTELGM